MIEFGDWDLFWVLSFGFLIFLLVFCHPRFARLRLGRRNSAEELLKGEELPRGKA